MSVDVRPGTLGRKRRLAVASRIDRLAPLKCVLADTQAILHMLASVKKFFESFIEPEIQSPARRESGLQVATAALLLEMMRMDGHIKDDERASVTAVLKAQFNLTEDLIAELMALAEQEASQANDYYQFTSLINRVCDYAQKISIIEKLWHVAMVDGHLDVHEMHLMRKLADLLHVGRADYLAAKQRARESANLPR